MISSCTSKHFKYLIILNSFSSRFSVRIIIGLNHYYFESGITNIHYHFKFLSSHKLTRPIFIFKHYWCFFLANIFFLMPQPNKMKHDWVLWESRYEVNRCCLFDLNIQNKILHQWIFETIDYFRESNFRYRDKHLSTHTICSFKSQRRTEQNRYMQSLIINLSSLDDFFNISFHFIFRFPFRLWNIFLQNSVSWNLIQQLRQQLLLMLHFLLQSLLRYLLRLPCINLIIMQKPSFSRLCSPNRWLLRVHIL